MNTEEITTVLNQADAVYLATQSSDGPVIRALVNLRRSDLYPGPSRIAQTSDFTIYLSTSRSSAKVREIDADPRVSLYYCLPQSFKGVTLNGRAEHVEDPSLGLGLWHDSWRIYWPDGPDNPDYCILRVRPNAVFGWNGSVPFCGPTV